MAVSSRDSDQDVSQDIPESEGTVKARCTASASLPGLMSSYTQERPILILIGSEKYAYHIHRGLLTAKSPFFQTMLKDCWDGTKQEIEVSSLTREAFEIVIHWIYTGRLPDINKQYPHHGQDDTDIVFLITRAADVLMMKRLQNEVILAEANVFRARNLTWHSVRLKRLSDADLSHTRYYQFVLKSVIHRIMSALPRAALVDQVHAVGDDDKVLADILRGMADWQRNPWPDFPKGDLSEFLVKDDAEMIS